jgi:putative SOS response-associated peptidase YedK
MPDSSQRMLRVERDVEPKQPYYIHRQDDEPIGFAALRDTWKHDDESSAPLSPQKPMK